MDNIFPWCEKIWNNLLSSIEKNRLPHAILFYGHSGLGKAELATQFAQYLLCSNTSKNDIFCGTCTDCKLFNAKTHGDYYYLNLEEAEKSIGVDKIRELKIAAFQKPQRSECKIFILPSADKMTLAAENAFLKLLEEPPGKSIFILVSESKHALSSTILSRCHSYAFHADSLEKTQSWLVSCATEEYSEEQIKKSLEWSLGSPLFALRLLENSLIEEYELISKALLSFFAKEISTLDLIKSWQGKALAQIVFVAQIVCYYLLRGAWEIEVDKKLLYQWYEKLIQIKKTQASGIALNESLLQDYLVT